MEENSQKQPGSVILPEDRVKYKEFLVQQKKRLEEDIIALCDGFQERTGFVVMNVIVYGPEGETAKGEQIVGVDALIGFGDDFTSVIR